MKAGNKAVGHPVNVATGEVFVTVMDVQIPGRMPLNWERRYSTSLLQTTPSVLGPGWAIRYFSSLNVTEGGIDLITPEGERERFDDPDNLLVRGEKIIHYGTFQELEKRGDEYCLTQWNIDTGDIERFCYGMVPGSYSAFRLNRIEDVTGQALDVEWDSLGQLKSVRQHREGRSLSFTYLPGGLLDAVTLHGSKGESRLVVKHNYDEFGRLIQVTDGIGRIQGYAYDKDSKLTREVLKDGGVFSFQYDAQGRCVRTSGLDNYDAKTFQYLDGAGFTQVVDSRGYTSIYQWLPSGQTLAEVDPPGGRKETEYDEEGRIITLIDANGGITAYEYDDRGNRCKTTDPAGAVTKVKYNDSHQPVEVTDPGGQMWQRRYNQREQWTMAVDPENCQWQFEYDANGNLVRITNPNGAQRQIFYSSAGILNGRTDWEGRRTEFAFDGFGRLIRQQDIEGKETALIYDNADRLTVLRLRDGSEYRYNYDDGDNLIEIVDPAGRCTRYRYGTCGRLLEEIDALGQSVHYAWGSEPRHLEKITNEKGEDYVFKYNAAGRLNKQVAFDGRVIELEYDQAGNCLTERRNGEPSTRYEYNELSKVVKKTTADGKETTLEYDVFGNVISASNENITIAYERDYRGRVLRENQGDYLIKYRFDPLGLMLALETSLGIKMEYSYTASGALRSVRTGNGDEMRFDVDALGRETKRELPGGLCLWQEYNSLGQITAQTLAAEKQFSLANPNVSSPRPAIQRKYIYDMVGNLEKLSDAYWGDQAYGYDSIHRLAQVNSQESTESFVYDPAGNILSAAKTGQPTMYFKIKQGNRLESHEGVHFVYDDNGRLIQKIEARGDNAQREWRYEWDGSDQLIRVVDPDGEQWNYCYDPFGRRIQKIGPDGSTEFVWSGFDIIHETNGASVRTWMHDPFTFKPLAQLEGDNFYSVITDHLGIPRELIDRFGKIAWRSSYWAWGETRTEQERSKVVCPLRFPGQYYDDETGLHYNCFRYYDPIYGRYISPDPVGILGGFNEFTYAQNPVQYFDPFGLTYHGPKPGYVNPGHHDPTSPNFRGGGAGRTSILPPHAEALYRHSVPDSTGTHWYAVDNASTVHVFRNGNDGTVHWAGDTSQGRGIRVPGEVASRIRDGQIRVVDAPEDEDC